MALLELTAEKLHFHGPKSGKSAFLKVRIVPKTYIYSVQKSYMRFWRSTPLGPWKWQKSLFSRKSGILGVHTPWTSKMQSNIWNGVPTWLWREIAPIPSRCQGNTTYSWSVPRRDLAIFTNACQPCPPPLQTEIYSMISGKCFVPPPPFYHYMVVRW